MCARMCGPRYEHMHNVNIYNMYSYLAAKETHKHQAKNECASEREENTIKPYRFLSKVLANLGQKKIHAIIISPGRAYVYCIQYVSHVTMCIAHRCTIGYKIQNNKKKTKQKKKNYTHTLNKLKRMTKKIRAKGKNERTASLNGPEYLICNIKI